MSESKPSDQSPQPAQAAASPISSMFGPTHLFPGESAEVYQAGLIATIKDLGATTHLQTYLAEKIFQCLWWMRRYEIQKLDALIALRVKSLGQLQQSYEALVNRSVMQERLELQNELLKRDLQAIDVKAVEQVDSEEGKARGQRKAKSSQ